MVYWDDLVLRGPHRTGEGFQSLFWIHIAASEKWEQNRFSKDVCRTTKAGGGRFGVIILNLPNEAWTSLAEEPVFMMDVKKWVRKEVWNRTDNIHLSKSDNWLKLCYVIIGNPDIPSFRWMAIQADIFKQPLTVATFGVSLKQTSQLFVGAGWKQPERNLATRRCKMMPMTPSLCFQWGLLLNVTRPTHSHSVGPPNFACRLIWHKVCDPAGLSWYCGKNPELPSWRRNTTPPPGCIQ